MSRLLLASIHDVSPRFEGEVDQLVNNDFQGYYSEYAASHFAAHGVPVAGAIVNKVDLDAQPGIRDVLERGLTMNGA